MKGGGVGQSREAAGMTEGERERWSRPRAGVYKVNVDAGLIAGKGVGWGMVCRGSSGAITWAATIQDEGELEPKTAEALAIYHGVQEARRRGEKEVIIESDCLNVVEELNARKQGRSSIHLIYNDILSICNSFESCLVVFVSRKLNSVAHALAHHSPWLLGRREWTIDVPPYIRALAECDLSLMN
ncbi:uncharacterized protein LOC141621046 [Silene latifolia]|uniref:uncharacterized protein LOC141621046 n=1 Tax=Silene latifolia TaxID=37657 RepID=UPI003D78A2FA